MSSQRDDKIDLLLFKLLENCITDSEIQQLEDLISADDGLMDYYCDYVKNYAVLQIKLQGEIGSTRQENVEDCLNPNIWRELAEIENSSPRIHIAQEKQNKVLIDKTEYPRVDHQIKKGTLISLIVASAAVIFIVLFARYAPPGTGFEAAIVADCINAKWADIDTSIQNGRRLTAGERMYLNEGFVELLFDSEARVTLEAPADFIILSSDQIKLNFGRVYANVPPQAYGFQVTTPNAKIIDLGTEFGVQQDRFGSTELHVLKGKTGIVSGIRGNRINAYVEAGAANRLDGITGQLETIECNERLFVRRIDSETNLVWKGQTTLNLADIVRGGNGLGTGNSDVRLNPVKGFTLDQHITGCATAKGFLPVPELAFLDGIFVPDGHTKQIVSTRGDVFGECPQTSGIYEMDVLANPSRGIIWTYEGQAATIRFYDRDYTDDSDRSCIVLHANLGLTFDLNAVRKSYQCGINRFMSQVGMADLEEEYSGNADFWVLVDGQVRYSLRQYKEKGVLNDVSVEIKDTDRFLTLVTTDGGDMDDPEGGVYNRAISCDRGVFADPVLVLEK